MARKKPSLVARLNRDQLNIGWYQRGRPFMSCQAKKAANAEKSTVSSNMIGKKAGTVGRLFPGLTALISVYALIANPSDVQHILSSQRLLPAERPPAQHKGKGLQNGKGHHVGIGILIKMFHA